DVAQSLYNLAALSEAIGQTARAIDYTDRARYVSRRYIAHVLPALAEKEQTDFLRLKDMPDWHTALSLSLRHADAPDMAERSGAWLLNGKGLAQQTLAQASLRSRDSRQPQLRTLSERL